MNGKLTIQTEQSQTIGQQQKQRLMALPKMQQAIALLQASTLEMTSLIEAEMEQNPLLEYLEEESLLPEDEEQAPGDSFDELSFDEADFGLIEALDENAKEHLFEHDTEEERKKRSYHESLIQATPQLFSQLMEQVESTFETKEERFAAKLLIGNLEPSGLLTIPLEEIAQLEAVDPSLLKSVLKNVQTFTPYGIGATSLQESLLIQLRCLGLEKSLAYRIIETCFAQLLQNQILQIAKQLSSSKEAVQEAIDQQLARLRLHPSSIERTEDAFLFADVSLFERDGALIVEVADEALPPLCLNRRYLQLLRDPNAPHETRAFVKQKLLSARWLMRAIDQRNTTLKRIASALAERQHAFFFDANGRLVPLTLKEIADQLELHESTVARAVADKALATPRGLFPLKFFFTNGYMTGTGENLSSETVRQLLRSLIDGEEKSSPLSDEAIARAIQKKGIPCARRTVAKYRTQMKIGNQRQRRR